MTPGTLFDITRPVQTSLAVWPGDTPYEFRLTWKQSEGASVNVGSVTMSVHTGTHADAPFHFDSGAPAVADLPLAPFLGPAIVLDVRGHAVIRTEHLDAADLAATPRVLLSTDAWTDDTCFPNTIPVLAPDVPAYLDSRGVLLVGLDVPSVDALESTDLPNHHALRAAGVHILESLRLAHVPPGIYELIALPLRLVGADGSPVRAVLRGA